MADISGIWSTIQRDMWQDTGLNGDAQRIEQLGWMLFFKIFSDKDQELELLDDNYKSPIPPELHWDKWAGDDEGMTGEELQVFVDRTLFPALRNIPVVNNKRALILREVFEGNNNYMKSGINIRKVLNKLNEIDFNIKDDRHAFGDVYEGVLKNLQSAGKSGEFYTPRAITQFITEMVDPRIGEKVLDPACGTGGFLTNAIEHLRKGNTNIETLKAIQDNVIGWEYKPLPFLLATTNLILHDVEEPNITFRDALDQPLTNYTEKDRVNVIIANPPFGGIVANNNETNFPQNYRTKESADLFLILMIHLLKMEGRAGIVLPDGSLTGEGVKQRVRQRLLTECNLHTIIRLPNSVFQPYATVATNLLFFTKGTPTKEVWYYEHRLPEGQKSYNKTRPLRLEELQPIADWWGNRVESDVCWKVNISTIKGRGYDLDIKNNRKEDKVFSYNSEEVVSILGETFSQSSRVITQIEREISDGKSNLTNLFEKLGLRKPTLEGYSVEVINSKNFIGELRQAFLSEAMKAKLVPQDSKDETAAILLKKIGTEMTALTAEKKIKKEKPISELKLIDFPYMIPKSWEWCRLAQITKRIHYGLNASAKHSKDGVRLLRITDIQDNSVEWSTVPGCDYTENDLESHELNENDIVIARTGGTIGKSYLVRNLSLRAVFASYLIRAIPSSLIEPQFLKFYLESPLYWKQLLAAAWGAGQPNVNGTSLSRLSVPLPPRAEQKRIVEKLGKLMAFCDELEANIRQSKHHAETLLQVALKEALEPK